MSDRLPSTPPNLSGYTYRRALGTGGFADVFLFEQALPRRDVAVKVLLANVVDDGVLGMFNAEADVMARLSAHPSILTVYQASVSSDGRPYIVMEYCPSSLGGRYRREQIPVREVLDVGVRVGAALESAHRAGVLHRDIKPSNILVTTFGVPVLGDFGIATSLAQGRRGARVAMSMPWAAPEVIEERVTGTVASEVWSYAATVYSLLTGRSPFEVPGAGMNSKEKLQGRIRQAKYLPTGRDDVPPQLEEALRRGLSRDPAARPARVADLAYELQLVQHALGLPSTPLEVGDSGWAGEAVATVDGESRGPLRAHVEVSTRRRASHASASSSHIDDVPLDAPPRTVSLRVAALLAVASAVVGALATIGVLAAGGMLR